jgi:hypothetical protein
MRINAKQLLAVAVSCLALAGCGGGGGGTSQSGGFGGSGNSGTQQPGGNGGSGNGGTPTQPSSSITPFSTYLYSGTTDVNIPIITVYIDGKPVTLLADTGASGLIVNQSAVNIPNSDLNSSYTFSVTFGDGSSVTGIMASATVCVNPSNTASCIVMPIGLITSGSNNDFQITGTQGDFGLDSGLNIMDIGYNLPGSSITGYSYPTYLAQQYGMNSYTLSFYPLSNTFYANVSATTPIGEITFGVYNGNSNTLIPYAMGLFSGLPVTTGIFASATSSYTDSVFFDTGSNFNFFSTSVLQTEIPNFSQSSDEGNCANYGWPSNMVNGGFALSYTLQNYNTSFTTEPSLSLCQSNSTLNIIIGNTLDNGSGMFDLEDFGLSEMLRHTFTWVLDNGGLVQDIGISP